MTFSRITLPTLALVILTACAPKETDIALSGFMSQSGGTLDVNNLALRTTRVQDGDDGFVVQIIHEQSGLLGILVGSLPEVTEINAVAGIIPTTTVTDLGTGTLTFTGDYVVRYEDDIVATTSGVIGDSDTERGTIELVANFDAGTLTGSEGNLTVSGTFTDNDLDGAVDFRGMSGDLDGLIGGDKAVGVFHGNNDDTVFAGGFLVD